MNVFSVVEWGLLFEVIWVSMIAGIGVTAVFSTVIYAGSRATEARRDGQDGLAVAFGVLAFIAFVAFMIGCVYGVSIILTK